MAITYPIDLLADFKGGTTDFQPLYRQEQSRQTNGVTRVKDMGNPLWTASYQSIEYEMPDVDYWRARLEALEGGLKTFRAYSLARIRPIAHPGSAALPTGALHTIAANRKEIRVNNIAGITLSVGDLIQIGTRNLHRVMEPAAGTLTALFEVRPHLWPETAVGDAVTLLRPSCIMTIVPGSVSTQADAATGRGVVTFEAVESR